MPPWQMPAAPVAAAQVPPVQIPTAQVAAAPVAGTPAKKIAPVPTTPNLDCGDRTTAPICGENPNCTWENENCINKQAMNDPNVNSAMNNLGSGAAARMKAEAMREADRKAEAAAKPGLFNRFMNWDSGNPNTAA